MSDFSILLKRLGLSDKEAAIYLALLELGPSPVRTLSQHAKINRGTTYDALKLLREIGLVSYFHKRTHQYFVAENPQRLLGVLDGRRNDMEKLQEELANAVPELSSIADRGTDKPVVKYYEGSREIAGILHDVLDVCTAEKQSEYYVFSAADIRNVLYTYFPTFNAARKAKKIRVKVIAIGKGGSPAGLDERKWLTKATSASTYIIIYANTVAMISVNASGVPIGVIIRDRNLAATQRIIFESIWNTL